MTLKLVTSHGITLWCIHEYHNGAWLPRYCFSCCNWQAGCQMASIIRVEHRVICSFVCSVGRLVGMIVPSQVIPWRLSQSGIRPQSRATLLFEGQCAFLKPMWIMMAPIVCRRSLPEVFRRVSVPSRRDPLQPTAKQEYLVSELCGPDTHRSEDLRSIHLSC